MAKKKQSYLSKKLNFLQLIFDTITSTISNLPTLIKNNKTNLNSWSKLAREKLKNPSKANFDLGLNFYNLHQYSDAAFRFKLASLMNSQSADAFFWLGKTQLVQGKNSKAQKNFVTTLALNPTYKDLNYFLSLDPQSTNNVLPNDDIIHDYFDNFAGIFDSYYVNTYAYTGLAELSATLRAHTNSSAQLNVLELGCGNGILGKTIKQNNLNFTITGLDSSAAMINSAKDTKIIIETGKKKGAIIDLSEDKKQEIHESTPQNVYNYLIHNDFLQQQFSNDQKYDVIIAKGFINYIDNLELFFQKINNILSDKGTVLFYHTEPYSPDNEKLIIKNMTFPFYLRRRYHDSNKIEQTAKKYSLHNLETHKFNLESSTEATLFVYSKA